MEQSLLSGLHFNTTLVQPCSQGLSSSFSLLGTRLTLMDRPSEANCEAKGITKEKDTKSSVECFCLFCIVHPISSVLKEAAVAVRFVNSSMGR